jgi:serine protease AprX
MHRMFTKVTSILLIIMLAIPLFSTVNAMNLTTNTLPVTKAVNDLTKVVKDVEKTVVNPVAEKLPIAKEAKEVVQKIVTDSVALAPAEKIGSSLKEKMNKTASTLEVIVSFNSKKGPGTKEKNLLESVGITKGIMFKSLPMAGVVATPAQINALAKDSSVRSIYFNEKLQYDNEGATHISGAKKVITDPTFRKQNGGLSVSGKGVTVLVNDSGVDGTHKDLEFGSKVIQNVLGTTNLSSLATGLLPISYTENVRNTDTAGHGTHVAGTVGGLGVMSSGKHAGVAPGVNIVGYGSGAVLFILDTLGGFDYALTHQHQYNIRVITNSFGSTGDVGTEFDPNNPTNIATKTLYDNGIVVVFSAGNSGPAESTITGNFKKAPWIITVAAGDKFGRLAEFSSRGVEGKGGTVEVDGVEYEWVDRPTVTAPGVDIISTRGIDALAPLGLQDEVEKMDPAHVPYYTYASGTSMAAPHVAGIVALLLDANPTLSPDEVKAILQQTATPIPGKADWEVGAGYVNAYAAVDCAMKEEACAYGKTLKLGKTFNNNVDLEVKRQEIAINYSPVGTSEIPFEVVEGLTEIAVTVYGKGIEETGNPVNLILKDPTGKEYSSGISLLFALYYDRTVIVPTPVAGTWKIEIRGIRGDTANPIGSGVPETVQGTVTTKKENGHNIEDIAGHKNEEDIILAVHNRLVDGGTDKNFRPDAPLTRMELAKYLTIAAGIRQALPLNGVPTVTDVAANDLPFVEAVLARGAALKDQRNQFKGVMLADNGKFNGTQAVKRYDLAYSIIQSLGLENEAKAANNGPLTVNMTVNGSPIVAEVVDADQIPAGLKGYMQLALDKKMFVPTNAKYDFATNKLTVEIKPATSVTRADYAKAINAFYADYLK